eukprot:Em0010g200a
MRNDTLLCITSLYQYTMELEVGNVLSAAYRNGTQCYQSVKSRACQFYFESFQPAATNCETWCESANSTSVSHIFSQRTWECDGKAYYNDNSEKNCSTFFYYDATSGLCQPTCDVDNGDEDDLMYVFVSIGMLGYVTAFVIACINWKIMTLDAYRHRIHAGVVLLCIAMPWVGVAAIAGSNSVDAVFYASLPLYGSCGLICALVGLIVWKLMGQEMQKDKVCLWLKCQFSCSPEVKLTIVLIFVVLLFVATVARNVLDTNKTHEYFYDYLLCESAGSQLCTLHVSRYVAAIQYFDAFHNAVFSLSSYFSLVYIVPLHRIKKMMRRDSQQPIQRNNTIVSIKTSEM